MVNYTIILASLAIFGFVHVYCAHDLILGKVSTGDRQLFWRSVQQAGRNGTTAFENVVYLGGSNITCIRALDQVVNGTGGFASLVSGGLGRANATLSLRGSQPGFGYNFIIDIWGR